DDVDGSLVTGNHWDSQFGLQGLKGPDGAPVGAGEENAIRMDSRKLGLYKLHDLRRRDAANVKVCFDIHAGSFDDSVAGFAQGASNGAGQVFYIGSHYRNSGWMN